MWGNASNTPAGDKPLELKESYKAKELNDLYKLTDLAQIKMPCTVREFTRKSSTVGLTLKFPCEIQRLRVSTDFLVVEAERIEAHGRGWGQAKPKHFVKNTLDLDPNFATTDFLANSWTV